MKRLREKSQNSLAAETKLFLISAECLVVDLSAQTAYNLGQATGISQAKSVIFMVSEGSGR